MRILYHHRTASKDGQAVHIEEMIAAMCADGHEVRVVAPEIGDPGKMGAEAGMRSFPSSIRRPLRAVGSAAALLPGPRGEGHRPLVGGAPACRMACRASWCPWWC